MKNVGMSNKSSDIEKANGPKEYLEGFADFSHYISSDETLSIYRRFGTLASRNLVYLQAELQHLELKLKELDDSDIELLSREVAGSGHESVLDSAKM